MKKWIAIITAAIVAAGAGAEEEAYTNTQEVVSQPAKIELVNEVTLNMDGPEITWTYAVQALDADGEKVVLVRDGETIDKADVSITLAEWKQVLTSMGLNANQFALNLNRSLLKAAKYKLTD